MSYVKVVFHTPEGECHIMTPTIEALQNMPLEKIIEKSNSENYPYTVVLSEEIPTSRVFRGAWVFDSESEVVVVDVEKAKNIKKEIFRGIRAPLINKHDVEYLIALERSQDTSEIVAKKQALRDVTGISLPDDIEELESFLPDILKTGE